jgi:hypothetical protein
LALGLRASAATLSPRRPLSHFDKVGPRQRIFGDRVRGGRIHAAHAREEAKQGAREVDAAECRLSSEQKKGFGGHAQPSPTILKVVNVTCHRCETRASVPLDAIRRPREYADLENLRRR